MANLKSGGGYVIVYQNGHQASAAEIDAYDGPLQAKFRNVAFFDEDDHEWQHSKPHDAPKAVYTDSPRVRKYYEGLGIKVERIRLPKATEAPEDEKPTASKLIRMTKADILSQYGEAHGLDDGMKRSEMIAEITGA